MGKNMSFIHPYIPNSAPEIKKHLLKEIGIKDVEEIYKVIPEHLRLKRKLDLPEPYPSEFLTAYGGTPYSTFGRMQAQF